MSALSRLLAFIASGWSAALQRQPVTPHAPGVQQEAAPIAAPLSAQDRDTLIRTVWGEARGEPEDGMVAVVHVVRNRVLARGTDAHTECLRPWQFSAWNAGDPNRPRMIELPRTSKEYVRIGAVVDAAWRTPDTTGGARHYHAVSIAPPGWAAEGRVTLRLGGHVFYAGVR